MEVHQPMQSQARKAGLLSLIPGVGQLYNKQTAKGILFFVVGIIFLLQFILKGFDAFFRLVSLGVIPMQDHSLFMLIRGTVQMVITVIFLIFYVAQIKDARDTRLRLLAGEKIPMTPKELLASVYENGFPYLLIVPAYIFMTISIIFPVLVTIFISFTNYNFQHIPPAFLIDWTGLANFLNIFSLSTMREAFLSVLSWTLIWTVCATTLSITLGVLTAVIANQKFIVGRRFFGVIFLLPWAVPAFITILTFSNMFNDSFGAINLQVIPFLNHLLPFVNIPALAWKTDPTWTKVAIILVQGWLGFPYIYVMVTGILQSIPEDLYEAARIDGASASTQFRTITLPMIMAVAAPTFVTQYTQNFNNFSMIYLFNDGGPGSVGGNAGSTDILISWIYKLTTGQSPQYSIAAALTLIISIIVISVSLLVFRRTRAFEIE
ncbi:MAG: sugar ABC transporter permease [Aerococcus sp.]|nr:sugar ABC transporter permease [Aerococcus sp.]